MHSPTASYDCRVLRLRAWQWYPYEFVNATAAHHEWKVLPQTASVFIAEVERRT